VFGGRLSANSLLVTAALACICIRAGETRANTIVQFSFNGGITDSNGAYLDYVQVGLFDDQAPLTVANFLRYVNNGVYNGSLIHRAVSQFIVQGGGFMPVTDPTSGAVTAINPLPAYGPVQNEFSASRSNVAGTIAMAKLGSDPNSATNQWFFNVVDNSSNLDNQNGGFTVFGQVLGSGMHLIDAIDGLPTYNLNQYFDPNYAVDGASGGPFTDVPLVNFANSINNFIVVESVTVVPPASPRASWASAVSGIWSDVRKWTGGVPNAAGAIAVFNTSTTAALTITLENPQTVGTLQFGNSGGANVGYTLSGSGSDNLTLNNSGSGVTIAITDSSHVINAPVVLADNLRVTTGGSNRWTLSFGTASSITDNGSGYSLTMSGSGGTLVLSGSDTYSGGTTVTAGTLAVTSSIALPGRTSLTVGAGGTFVFDPAMSGAPAAAAAIHAVPEPSTFVLLAVGAIGLGLRWKPGTGRRLRRGPGA